MEPSTTEKHLFGGPMFVYLPTYLTSAPQPQPHQPSPIGLNQNNKIHDSPWDPKVFRASDDTVRGGSSHSTLTVHRHALDAANANTAVFSGTLEITALGGAGFASQQTTGDLNLDLSSYDGIVLKYRARPGTTTGIKKYTLLLKDEIPGRGDDGRERSAVCWEAEFDNNARDSRVTTVRFKWSDFRATYRGKNLPDQDQRKGLDTGSVKRLGIMVRSFFDEQSGDFELEIESIAAYREGKYRNELPRCTNMSHNFGDETDISGITEGQEITARAKYQQRYRDEPEQMAYNNNNNNNHQGSGGSDSGDFDEKVSTSDLRQKIRYRDNPEDAQGEEPDYYGREFREESWADCLACCL
ncbi:complex I intermediate-associated protein 30-domain-containing protein [Aspergillus pseudoustus]|uniref:Complex I intermediate-associated protein 30-domain-containing protein n=1 Tax=Aspergillus pseudoustus TaxID=1810923 RepID=A0ABR4KGU3_9EURO